MSMVKDNNWFKPPPTLGPGRLDPYKHLAAAMVVQALDDLRHRDTTRALDALAFFLDDDPDGDGAAYWLRYCEIPHGPETIFEDAIIAAVITRGTRKHEYKTKSG
jgi:hypothetical protein